MDIRLRGLEMKAFFDRKTEGYDDVHIAFMGSKTALTDALKEMYTPGTPIKVLDLGAGCRTLGLLLCAKDRFCHVVGLELDEKSHLAALENISRNQLADRLSSICCDLRSIPGSVKAGQITTCVSNPPYFSSGPVSQSTPLARHESACAPEELFAAADHALRYGGDFYLVHKPERLAQLCACAARHHLEP